MILDLFEAVSLWSMLKLWVYEGYGSIVIFFLRRFICIDFLWCLNSSKFSSKWIFLISFGLISSWILLWFLRIDFSPDYVPSIDGRTEGRNSMELELRIDLSWEVNLFGELKSVFKFLKLALVEIYSSFWEDSVPYLAFLMFWLDSEIASKMCLGFGTRDCLLIS